MLLMLVVRSVGGGAQRCCCCCYAVLLLVVRSVVVGGAECCWQVIGWGKNQVGQLGRPANAAACMPVDIIELPDGAPICELAAGQQHTLALRADGSAIAWGVNECGQLGRDRGLSSRIVWC